PYEDAIQGTLDPDQENRTIVQAAVNQKPTIVAITSYNAPEKRLYTWVLAQDHPFSKDKLERAQVFLEKYTGKIFPCSMNTVVDYSIKINTDEYVAMQYVRSQLMKGTAIPADKKEIEKIARLVRSYMADPVRYLERN